MNRPSGDDHELAVFCQTEHARLVGILALYTGNRAVAEELAQEAFIRACEHWSRLRGMANRRSWLARVGLNLANSWLRRRYAERRAQARHGATGAVVADDTADVLAVRAAVAALPRRQRTALVLRYYAGVPAAEAARQMRCSEQTVRSLTHRAISTLRERAGLFEEEELLP